MDIERPVRILIVDEEEPIAHVLRLGLELEGWRVSAVATGAEAVVAAAGADIVLLDQMLPDMLGTEVVAELRALGSSAHVIFLTGRDEHEDRAAAYAAGADDYLTKPFGVEEVVDRLRQATRRLGLAPSSLRVGDLVLDVEAGMAWRGETLLPITSLEFELLRELAAHTGRRTGIGDLSVAASRRGVRVPRELAERLLQRTRDSIAATGSPLLSEHDGAWVLDVAPAFADAGYRSTGSRV
jgi:two-component system, OmpR family, response regulator